MIHPIFSNEDPLQADCHLNFLLDSTVQKLNNYKTSSIIKSLMEEEIRWRIS